MKKILNYICCCLVRDEDEAAPDNVHARLLPEGQNDEQSGEEFAAVEHAQDLAFTGMDAVPEEGSKPAHAAGNVNSSGFGSPSAVTVAPASPERGYASDDITDKVTDVVQTDNVDDSTFAGYHKARDIALGPTTPEADAVIGSGQEQEPAMDGAGMVAEDKAMYATAHKDPKKDGASSMLESVEGKRVDDGNVDSAAGAPPNSPPPAKLALESADTSEHTSPQVLQQTEQQEKGSLAAGGETVDLAAGEVEGDSVEQDGAKPGGSATVSRMHSEASTSGHAPGASNGAKGGKKKAGGRKRGGRGKGKGKGKK